MNFVWKYLAIIGWQKKKLDLSNLHIKLSLYVYQLSWHWVSFECWQISIFANFSGSAGHNVEGKSLSRGPKHEIFETEFFYTNHTCMVRWLRDWWKKLIICKCVSCLRGFRGEFLTKRMISMRLITKSCMRCHLGPYEGFKWGFFKCLSY